MLQSAEHLTYNRPFEDLGLFLFGTSRVGEFLEKGFPFVSVGNDLHHILTQATAYVKDIEGVSKDKGKAWSRRPTNLM